MLARVARWEGGEPEALRRSADEINGSPRPPEGVPATGFMMLTDDATGNSLAIALFETEEDLRAGDAALNAMSPSGQDVGRRTSVETYEVAVDLRL